MCPSKRIPELLKEKKKEKKNKKRNPYAVNKGAHRNPAKIDRSHSSFSSAPKQKLTGVSFYLPSMFDVCTIRQIFFIHYSLSMYNLSSYVLTQHMRD